MCLALENRFGGRINTNILQSETESEVDLCKLQTENSNFISQQNQLYVANKKQVDSQWTQSCIITAELR